MKRVLFIVDHKHRDLAASALIGFYLKKDGYEVAYCAPWHEDKIVKEFSPNIIVLPKPIYKNHIFEICRECERRVLTVGGEPPPH